MFALNDAELYYVEVQELRKEKIGLERCCLEKRSQPLLGFLGIKGLRKLKVSKVMVFGSDSSALKFLTKKIHVSSALPRKVKIWGSRAHNLLACFLPSFLPSARCLIRRSSSTCALLCFVPIPFWREHKGSLSANLANRFYFAPQFCFSPAKFFAFLSH